MPLPSANFVPSIDVADGLKAIAFRLRLSAEPFTGVVPSVLSVSFAVADKAAED